MAQIYGTLGQYAVCRLRVSRLGANCAPVSGANNAVVSKALVTMTATPEREDGTEYTARTGCNEIAFSVKECDREKRMTISMDLCTRDLELMELLTNARLVLDADGNTIGVERQGYNNDCDDGVGLEVWAKVGTSAGACAPDGDVVIPGWWRYTYPKGHYFLGEHSFANDVFVTKITGYSEVNPEWGDGPFNDYPGVDGLGTDTLESITLDLGGPPSAGTGYISVPAQ